MTDYFQLFGLPRKFDLNAQELRKKYLRLSRETHPDFFPHASETELKAIEEKSAQVNLAWKTLGDDILRLEHLLQLSGVEKDAAKLPQTFLMEMMDLNERVEEDGLTQQIREEIREGRHTLSEKLRNCTARYDAALTESAQIENLQEAALHLLCLKYYHWLEESEEKTL